MKAIVTLGIACAAALTAVPARASSCGDRIAALEARLDEAADTAISASSGGKGVAASREGQAVQGQAGGTAPPYQGAAQESQATERAAEAGGAGDRVMQAKATLNRARALDLEGDGAACQEALAEAEGQLRPN